MRRAAIFILTSVLLCSLLSIPAFALSAPSESGVWLTGVGSGFTVTPRGDDGATIAANTGFDCNEDGLADSFYASAARFTVKYSPPLGLSTGDNYVIIMYTGGSIGVNSILYINQITVTDADVSLGYLTFDVYPSSVKDAVIQVTSDALGNSGPVTAATVHRYVYYILGDTDEDGSVTTLDAVKILQYCVESIDFSESQLYAADTNKDGSITASDAVKILQYYVGSISGF